MEWMLERAFNGYGLNKVEVSPLFRSFISSYLATLLTRLD